ncbi:MAG: cupin domain-containing protein [Verrucomicrobiota bacterium]
MKQLLYLCLALAVPSLSVLAHSLEDHSEVEIDVLGESGSSWNGVVLPAYPTEAPQISIVKYTVPPHTRLPWHTHPSINAGYMVSGELTVTGADGQNKVLKAGEAIIEMVDLLHYGHNEGDVPAVIVVFYAGVADLPLAVLKEPEKTGSETSE